MVTLRLRTSAVTGKPEPPEAATEKEEHRDDLTIPVDDDSAVKQLRESWELASVLNFLNVFGPLVLDKLKLTAEEIEIGLIESNSSNAQLHIALLKGIPRTEKALDQGGDAWITVLCKKLAPWWEWIAIGEIPVTVRKGEEISEYQGLDPIDRLKFLKALCELRLDQDDVHTYIQETVKEGALDSHFRKRKLGGDGKNTSYWFDGNDIQGYRLYKEVNEVPKSAKAKKNASADTSCIYWETEATNLDDFQRVSRELLSSKTSSLAATGKMIEEDAIPVVEKLHKKKEREIKKKMKQEKALTVNIPRLIRATRSCRNRVPITYTYEEYDRMISKAVEETEETDGDEEEASEQESASMSPNRSSEGNKMKDEAAESDREGETENEKRKEEGEPKGEFNAKNRLRQRVTRNSALY